MKILVTGANGQLGMSIKNLEKEYPHHQIVCTDVEDLDITRREELERYFETNPVEYLVNCAAYTAVDRAEEDTVTAMLLNGKALTHLSACANLYGFTLIHISTDYVFSGKHHKPYREEDPPGPVSAYGRTKLEGEKAVLDRCKSGIILRTSWLYSEYGSNFLKTILRLSAERDELKIIDDQLGTPTYASDLARAIFTLADLNYSETGLFHFSNEGAASWYDFAKEIIALSGRKCRVTPIPTEAYPLPAKRPYYSLMSKRKFTSTFSYSIPHWKDSLGDCLKNMPSI